MKVLNGYVSGFSEGIYIGRAGKGKAGSVLANKFRIEPDGSRDEVIEKYRAWLWKKIKDKDPKVLSELRRIYAEQANVICFCAPKTCHGDVVLKAAKWLAGQEQ